MRNILNFNNEWKFYKNTSDITVTEGAELVNLPHTWNAIDGQDGGDDYFRGTCRYSKTIKKADLPEADCYYLEIRGANSSADVTVNGKKLAHHDGGYSTWRVNISNVIKEENVIEIDVDNAEKNRDYPFANSINLPHWQ